ncbi:PAS domain-containing protein [Halorubrum sp. DTA98]|uniref:PAS domain-containing protein n=1 Tax=Halorubrum sp. DTA98 TaxID=3402163 RepID=UPI003AB05AB1
MSEADDATDWSAVVVGLDREDTERLVPIRERFPDVPIVAYTERDNVDAAIDASRLGAEYVSGRRLDDDSDTLAERIETVIGTGSDSEPTGSTDDRDEFLESFLRITTDRRAELEEKLDALFDLGRDYLDLRIGFASRVSDDRFSVIGQQGADELVEALFESDLIDADGSIPLETTYCRRTIENGGVVTFTDATEAGWSDTPADELFGFETYIGGRVVAGDDVVGTFCFADECRRDGEFSDAERLFVELLAEWLGNELERRQAREKRAETAQRLENTLERIDDGFFAVDDSWELTYLNEEGAALLDREPDELVGKHVWSELPEVVGQRYERNCREAMANQRVVSFDHHSEPQDLWTEVTAYPAAEGLSVFVRDVTDRKHREETFRELLATSERLQRADDIERIADHLVDATRDILDYDINGVRLYDPDEDVLELVAMSDGLRELFGTRTPRKPGDGVVGRVFETGTHEVCSDLTAIDDDREYRGVRSVIAVPLSTHGVLTVASAEPDAFDESDVSVVQLLATNAIAAMDRVDRLKRLHTYESALENVDDMVCVLDEAGRVTYVTRPLAAWLDAERDALLGRRLSEVLPGSHTGIAAALDGGSDDTETVPLMLPRSGGPPRRGELRLSTLGDGTSGSVGSVTDTTELARARTERDHERGRFTRLFEQIPDPVIETALREDETVVRQINGAFADRFGYDVATIGGRPIDELDLRYGRRVDRVDSRSLDERIRDEGVVTAEIRRRTVDGPREFLFRGFSYETAEGRHAFGIYTDITERKHRERYLQVVNRILRHNLRNELNVVFGFASEISRIADDENIVDYADRIGASGKRLAELGEGASEIKRIVEDGLESELGAVSVRPIADRIAERYASGHPHATVDVDVPESTSVRADGRLADVLDHLVENAIVHADDPSPRVEIGVDPDPETDVVAVTVADDGPGIAEDIREIVAGDEEITQLRHNSGIGLWIVAWVVDSYGGDVEFGPGLERDGESDGAGARGGTTVRLRLPRMGPTEST